MQLPTDIEFRKYIATSVRKFQKSGKLRNASDGYNELGRIANYPGVKNYMDGNTTSIPLASGHKVIKAINRLEAE